MIGKLGPHFIEMKSQEVFPAEVADSREVVESLEGLNPGQEVLVRVGVTPNDVTVGVVFVVFDDSPAKGVFASVADDVVDAIGQVDADTSAGKTGWVVLGVGTLAEEVWGVGKGFKLHWIQF